MTPGRVGRVVVVGFAYQLADLLQIGGEERRVVVVEYPLFDGHHTLQPHPGVDAGLGQGRESAVLAAVVLHKDKVPDLKEPVPVAPHHILGGVEMLLPLIVEDLRAGTARSGVTHLPEVVLVPETQYPIFGDMLFPQLERLIIAVVYGDPELLDRQPQIVRRGDELPRIRDRLFFEIIGETEGISKSVWWRAV